MDGKIDYDRGVMKRVHPSLGVNVYMYIGTPGVYLNIYGTEVSEELAKAAGFDTVRFSKDKLKRELMAKAISAIETDLDMQADFTERVIAKAGDFSLVAVNAYGGHMVVSPDGDRLTPYAMPAEQAKALLGQLAPGKPIVDVDAPEPQVDFTVDNLTDPVAPWVPVGPDKDKDPEPEKVPEKIKARSFADM